MTLRGLSFATALGVILALSTAGQGADFRCGRSTAATTIVKPVAAAHAAQTIYRHA